MLMSRNGFLFLYLSSFILMLSAFLSHHESGMQLESVQGYIRVADSKVYYESTGKGKPLLFLHGEFMDHRMWEHQKQFFSTNHQVVTCDLPNSSFTEYVDSGFVLTEAIKVLQDSLHLGPVELVGHSSGAVVALDFALKDPGHVKKLILYSPGDRDWKTEQPNDSVLRKNRKLMGELLTKKKDTAAFAEYFIRSWFDGPYRHPMETVKEERARALQMAMDNAKSSLSRVLRFDVTPVRARLKDLKIPVLVVTGDLDNTITHDIADSLALSIGDSRRAVIPGTAHMANMENRIDFNQLLYDFLSRR